MQCIKCSNVLKETAKVCIRCGTVVKKGVEEVLSNKQEPDLVAVQSELHDEVNDLTKKVLPEQDKESVAKITEPIFDSNHLKESSELFASPKEINTNETSREKFSVNIEVSPEFSSLTPKHSEKIQPIPKKIHYGIISAVAFFVVLSLSTVYFFNKPPISENLGSDANAKGVEKSNVQKPSDQNPLSEINSTNIKGDVDKDTLNQILVSAGKNEWDQVGVLITQSKPLQFKTLDRSKARQFNQKGLEALKEVQLDIAVGFFKNGIEQDLNDAEIKNNLGFAYLKMKKYELAKVAILDALLVSPTRGIAWLNATEIFAELDNNQVATQALRVALHFATNKQKAIETLSDENKITSEKMRSIVKKNLVDAEQIPTFQRN